MSSCENDSAVLALAPPLPLPIHKSSVSDYCKGSIPRTRERPCVDSIKNAPVEPSCHCTGTTTVVRSNQNVTYVIRESRPEPPRARFFKTSKSKHSPTKRNPVACPHNEPGLSAHWPQSGDQPVHLSLLPSTGSGKPALKHLFQEPLFFFFLCCTLVSRLVARS